MDVKQPTDEELKKFLLTKYLEENLNNQSDHNKKLNSIIEKYKKKLAKVTPKLFFEFLTEKGFTAKCVSCGSPNLSVPESVTYDSDKIPDDLSKFDNETKSAIMDGAITTHVSYIYFEKKPDDVIGLTKSYYKMHCLNCGHLSLYRSSTVLKWVESKEGNNE